MLGQLGKRRVTVLDTGAGVSSVCAGLHGPMRLQDGAVRYPDEQIHHYGVNTAAGSYPGSKVLVFLVLFVPTLSS